MITGKENTFSKYITDGGLQMNGQIITNIHEDIVKVLIERLQNKHDYPVFTYEELCKKIGNQISCRNIAPYLGDISCWCDNIGAPMISAMVISRNNNRPGKGFYKLYAELHGTSVKNLDEELTFISELKKVLNYPNWETVKFYLGI